MRGAETFAFEDMTFLDPGTVRDPFVAGFDHLGERGIAQDVGRHIAEDPGNGGVDRRLAGRFLCLLTPISLRLRDRSWGYLG